MPPSLRYNRPPRGHIREAVASKKPFRGSVDEYFASRERLTRASAEFLKVDLEMARTFLFTARQTADVARQERNRKAARRAYDTVLRLLERVKLKDDDVRVIVLGLEELRSELEKSGESF